MKSAMSTKEASYTMLLVAIDRVESPVVSKADIVFLFTGETGEQYGYSDGWDGDYFMYTGEGQTGDMVFARGNSAVRDHEQNGKRLILMQTTQPTFVKVVGEFACVDYEFFEAPDKDNMSRRAIRFVLETVDKSDVRAPETRRVTLQEALQTTDQD